MGLGRGEVGCTQCGTRGGRWSALSVGLGRGEVECTQCGTREGGGGVHWCTVHVCELLVV